MSTLHTRVLIVEDDFLVSEMTRSIRPDVVLMDIGLPDMDGVKATQLIYESCPTPVVILTAHDAPELVEQASAASVGAYLVKPPGAREMERAITITIARFNDMMELRRVNAELGQNYRRSIPVIRRWCGGHHSKARHRRRDVGY